MRRRVCIRRESDDSAVPRIGELYGIVIAMFHATYASETVVVAIERARSSWDRSPRALRLVLEWADLHRDELRLNWGRARTDAPLKRIDPLP